MDKVKALHDAVQEMLRANEMLSLRLRELIPVVEAYTKVCPDHIVGGVRAALDDAKDTLHLYGS